MRPFQVYNGDSFTVKQHSEYRGLGHSLSIIHKKYFISCPGERRYCQTSNIKCTLTGNKIVDHSDVVGASPVGAAPITSSFWTIHLASMDWAKTIARGDEKHLSFGVCPAYIRGLAVSVIIILRILKCCNGTTLFNVRTLVPGVACISNCIPQNTAGRQYLSMPEIPASGTKVLICRDHSVYAPSQWEMRYTVMLSHWLDTLT